MFRMGDEPKYSARNFEQPKGNVWRVYRRLLGYVWHYKGRLAVSVAFALVVAVSFTAMILAIAAVVQTVFGDAEKVFETVDQYAQRIEAGPSILRDLVLWLPLPGTQAEGIAAGSVQARLRGLVAAMRRNAMFSLCISCALVLILSVVAGVARFFQEYCAGTIGVSISVRLARQMVQNIMHCSLSFFEKHPTGEILARLTNDVFQVTRGLAGVFVKVIREPIIMVCLLSVALRADPVLALIGLCVLPPSAVVLLKVGKQFKRSVKRSLQKIASLASLGSEVFGGIAIVKAFCMEDYELRRADAELDKLRRYLKRMVRADAAIGPLVELVLIMGAAAFVMFMGYRITYGGMEAGTLVQLIVPLLMILDPVRKLASVYNLILSSVTSAERVFEFIDVKPEILEQPGAVDLPPLRQGLRFENVRFSYDGKDEVLSGLDFEVKKGEMAAIVGSSGVGKSTVVKLIPRFYDVTDGAITFDGVDIRQATLKSLRRQIGIVTQDTVLFNETVRDNIAFGQESYSDDRVRQAAKAAHAHDFVERLAQGYQTLIGEGGGTLSGGERQRLAIARAILKDPAVLILDEATSNLDSESERAIQHAIDEFVVGRTTIVIAHRLSTVLRANRILVLDGGRIVEQGTHAELLERGGIYKRLYETQFEIAGERKP